jgi:hypothetical protein
LAFTDLRLRPPSQQQVEFFFPADEVGQPTRMESIAAFHWCPSQGRPSTHRSRNALEVLCSKVVKVKEIANELSRTFGNDHSVWFRNALQACRKVRRLAYDGLLLRSTRPDQITDYHQSRCDADTGLEVRVGCADCPLCVVFVCLGIPEIHEHPIAHVLRYEPAKAANGLGDALLIGRKDLAEVFRVHARRKCR